MMSLLKTLKFVGYSLPVAGLVFVMWEPQIQAMEGKKVDFPQLRLGTDLGVEPILPIPQKVNVDPDMAVLGKKLFNDPRMSEKGISCASCHNINTAGVDGLKVSIDIRGGKDLMNTPTVFNIGLNPLLTWYGLSQTLEDQIEDVLANPKHMDGNWENITARLKKDSNYKDHFKKLFDDGISRDNIKYAIASFERSLITPNSAFDNYLRGDVNAISEDQKKGYHLFKQYGCIACHQGMNIGGNLHAQLGTFISPFRNKKGDSPQSKFNLGRYNITKDESDKYVFRVPSLRNVAKTAPYFHAGEIKDLEKAIIFVAKYQLGREMVKEDVRLIAEFLRSLTGEYEGRLL